MATWGALMYRAIALAAATLLVAAPAGAQRAELERVIRRGVLPNGLEVIVVENHGVPLATVEVDVRNGSFTQSPEYAGLAHMYEHMFFKADSDYPEPDAFVARASELGAVFNGTTTEERVNYYLTLPADRLEAGMRLIASALRAPMFRPDELTREKEVVLGEYDRAESSPFFRLQVEMGRRLWPGQWSRKNVIGDRDVIRNVTPAQMRTIQQRYYVPGNSALVVTGDVTPGDVFALADALFGDWLRAPDPFTADPIPAIPALAGDDAVIVDAPVGAVTVLMQWQGPSVGKDPASTYAADVFSDALNLPTSGMSKRLVDSGLWQGVLVNYYTLDHTGPITISGQTTPDKLRAALAALEREIDHFADSGYVSDQQLAYVKAHRAVDSAFGRERTSGFTHTIGFWWAVASLDYYMGYNDNMARQTVQDLRRYASRYIVGRPRVVGVLITPEDHAALHLTTSELVRPAGTR
jgi:zinc protease